MPGNYSERYTVGNIKNADSTVIKNLPIENSNLLKINH